MQTDSLASIKAHFSAVVEQVGRTQERVTVTLHGRPAAVIISPADLSAMEATIELLMNERDLGDVRAGLADVEEGRMADLDDVLAELEERGRRSRATGPRGGVSIGCGTRSTRARRR